jgi:hypothetical protein
VQQRRVGIDLDRVVEIGECAIRLAGERAAERLARGDGRRDRIEFLRAGERGQGLLESPLRKQHVHRAPLRRDREVGIDGECPRERLVGPLPVPVVERLDAADRGVRAGLLRADRERAACRFPRERHDIGGRAHAVDRQRDVAVGERRPRRRVGGIDPDGVVEVVDAADQRRVGAPAPLLPALEVRGVGVEMRRPRRLFERAIRTGERGRSASGRPSARFSSWTAKMSVLSRSNRSDQS